MRRAGEICETETDVCRVCFDLRASFVSSQHGGCRFAVSHAVILAAWCGVLFLYGVAAGPLYRTESLRAIIGRECLHGHWLFPVLYGEPFLTKPPGQYAAIGLCSLPFGEVTAATRAAAVGVRGDGRACSSSTSSSAAALDERAALSPRCCCPRRCCGSTRCRAPRST